MGLPGTHAFLTYSNLLLNPAWLSEAERLREGKLKWVICICVLFEAYHKNSHSGNIVNSFIHLSSLIYLGIKASGFSECRVVLEARSLARLGFPKHSSSRMFSPSTHYNPGKYGWGLKQEEGG